MKIQTVALVAALTIVTTATGCSGMRNFLFGRGASCGICPTQGPACQQTPAWTPPTPELGCGFEPGCGMEPGCGHEGSFGHNHRGLRGCGLLGGGLCNGSSGCNCGSSFSGSHGAHSGNFSDPYAFGGSPVGSEFVVDPYNGYPQTIYPGSTSGGEWQGRTSEPGMQPVPSGNGRTP